MADLQKINYCLSDLGVYKAGVDYDCFWLHDSIFQFKMVGGLFLFVIGIGYVRTLIHFRNMSIILNKHYLSFQRCIFSPFRDLDKKHPPPHFLLNNIRLLSILTCCVLSWNHFTAILIHDLSSLIWGLSQEWFSYNCNLHSCDLGPCNNSSSLELCPYVEKCWDLASFFHRKHLLPHS